MCVFYNKEVKLNKIVITEENLPLNSNNKFNLRRKNFSIGTPLITILVMKNWGSHMNLKLLKVPMHSPILWGHIEPICNTIG